MCVDNVEVNPPDGMTPEELRHPDRGHSVVAALDHAYAARGVWTDLDRAGCNQLIRLVRRARDSAFGVDA